MVALGVGEIFVLALGVVAFRAGTLVGTIIFTTLAVLGAWSLVTFPLRFCVDDVGITVIRPVGARFLGWASIDRLTRMPGSFHISENERGRRSVSRRGGPLVAVVQRKRIVLSSVREDPLVRNAVIETAGRRGVSLSPSV